MFESIKEMFGAAVERNLSLPELIIQDEMETTNETRENITARMKKSLTVMQNALNQALNQPRELFLKEATGQAQKLNSPGIFFGKAMKEAMWYAMAIAEYNSGMGIIVAAPTAGSSGVLPAALIKAKEILKKTDEDVLDALFVAAAIGVIIGNRATLSGSAGGCQAEIGSAAAMAAGALTFMAGGTLDNIGTAVALTLQNLMGLVCDPVAGLVISPCIKRNAMGVVQAFLAAEMALSGVISIIPVDEVIDAMKKVGQQLPFDLKETGLGGIAGSPTGKRIKKQLFSDSKKELEKKP
jgi:L-serine dehydratase